MVDRNGMILERIVENERCVRSGVLSAQRGAETEGPARVCSWSSGLHGGRASAAGVDFGPELHEAAL
jgi:hypothetical protein